MSKSNDEYLWSYADKNKICVDTPRPPQRSLSPIISSKKNQIIQPNNIIIPKPISEVKTVVAKLPETRKPIIKRISSVSVPVSKILTGLDYAYEQMNKLTMMPETILMEQLKYYDKNRGRPDPITKKIVSSLKPILISVAPQDDEIKSPQDKSIYYKSKILARTDYQIKLTEY